jgi:nicotinamidase-related amidase
MKQLIVIDMQNDFVTGALANKTAQDAVPFIVNAIKESEFSVVFTADTHGNDYLNTLEGKNLPVKHCIEGTDGWNLIPEIESLDTKAGGFLVRKRTFGYLDWKKIFGEALNIDEFVIVGTVMPICPMSNAITLRATYPNKKITVDFRGCGFMGNTPEEIEFCKKAAKFVLNMNQIDVIE